MNKVLPNQQGDVLFKKIDKIPNNFNPIKNGTIVQAGEATGHAHRLQGRPGVDFQVFTEDGIQDTNLVAFNAKKKYLRVINPVALTHEEHRTQTLAPGEYEIGIVRELDHFEQRIRQVAD